MFNREKEFLGIVNVPACSAGASCNVEHHIQQQENETKPAAMFCQCAIYVIQDVRHKSSLEDSDCKSVARAVFEVDVPFAEVPARIIPMDEIIAPGD